eukprot:RCo053871
MAVCGYWGAAGMEIGSPGGRYLLNPEGLFGYPDGSLDGRRPMVKPAGDPFNHQVAYDILAPPPAFPRLPRPPQRKPRVQLSTVGALLHLPPATGRKSSQRGEFLGHRNETSRPTHSDKKPTCCETMHGQNETTKGTEARCKAVCLPGKAVGSGLPSLA